MTNISKRYLSTKQKAELSKQIVKLFATIHKSNAGAFFKEFFTEAEQIMFIKRLAIIMMLEAGYSKYRIGKTILVSESTVSSASLKYQSGAYSEMLKITRTKDFDKEKFWEVLEVLLRAGLPPRGRGRWKQALKGNYPG